MYKKHKQYRLYNYDYSQNGYYFITIVTKNRKQFLGEIIEQKMRLSQIGEYIKSNILKFSPGQLLTNPYENNPHFISNSNSIIGITEWAILPDHIHLVIEIINRTQKEYTTITRLSPLAQGSVSAFINHFKGNVKKWCNENDRAEFNWQRRFHDRVIRNNREYDRIAGYIRTNVLNWNSDDEFAGGEF